MRGQDDCVTAGRIHTLAVVYDRPWRQFWVKRRIVRCWHCGLRVPEPLWLRQPQVMTGVTAPPGPGRPL